MLEEFVRNEWRISSLVPLLFLIGSIFLLLAISLYVFRQSKYSSRARLARLFASLTLGFYLSSGLVYISEISYFQAHQAPLNPGIRTVKPGLLGYQTYPGELVVEGRKLDNRLQLSKMSIYEPEEVQSEPLDYLGFDPDKHGEHGAYYFQVGRNIAYLPVDYNFAKRKQGSKEARLLAEKYYLTDKAWLDYGFLDDRGPFVTQLQMPEDAQEKAFQLPEGREEFPLSQLLYEWIFPSK